MPIPQNNLLLRSQHNPVAQQVSQQGQQDFNKKSKPIHGTFAGSKSYVRRSRLCSLGNPSKWGWPEKNLKTGIKLPNSQFFFKDLGIFWASRLSIKAFIMLRDHGLVLESFRETKHKILKVVFQEMGSSKLLNSPHRLCKILQH